MSRFKFYALWLCLICIGIFVIQIIFSGFTDFFILNNSALAGEIWRFVSAIFLHGSPAHLIYNLFALALFGSILEKLIGGKKFLLVFFLSGIFANIIAINFYPYSFGASGAIYGILGCLTVLKPGMFVWAFGLPMPMFIAAILWAAGSVLGIFMPSNIGHIAHLSGIIIGFIFGLFLRAGKRRSNSVCNYKIKIPEAYMRNWEKRYLKS